MESENEKKDGPWWKPAYEIFSEVSTWIAVPIIIALIGGKALDKYYGTKPWMLLGCAGIAFITSSFGIVKTVKRYQKKISEEIKEKK